MNKFKIADELNEWVQKEFGSLYFIEINDGDLTLVVSGQNVAWFGDFKADEFDFSSSSSYDLGIKLIEKDIIKKFYEKAVELISKQETKYTVQVFPSEYGFLYKRDGDINDLLVQDLDGYEDCYENDCFTESEIDELKQCDDVAIDWNKAIIKEVDDDNE